jgi:hypothetical protein
MEKEQHVYWFAAKSHGLGWSLPVTWQGWLTLLGYCAATVAAATSMHSPKSRLICIVALSAALVAIVIWKGERPAKWRWRRR